MKSGEYDAILLAKAGVLRLQLELEGLVGIDLTPDEFVPAPAQGVLALQIRSNDTALRLLLSEINDPEVQKIVHLEGSYDLDGDNLFNNDLILLLAIFILVLSTGAFLTLGVCNILAVINFKSTGLSFQNLKNSGI